MSAPSFPWAIPGTTASSRRCCGASRRCLREGATPARVEAQVGAIRLGIVDAFMADDPADDPALTTRMRIARALARSDELFHRLSDGTLLSFGLDSGTFQRVSDLIMVSGRARRVVNVQRVGTLSFRSNDETALEGARRFRGGGHKDAAGGKLPGGVGLLAGRCRRAGGADPEPAAAGSRRQPLRGPEELEGLSRPDPIGAGRRALR